MSNPNTFEKSTGAVAWTWKPAVTFDTRWQKVTHVAIELDGNGAATQNVSVSLVDGEDAANDFKVMVGSGTLASRTHRLIEFTAPLLVEKGQSILVEYPNGSSRAVKAMIVAHS